MESLFGRYKNLLVLIVVLLAQVFGLAVQVRRPGTASTGDSKGVRVLRYWVVSVVAPPEAVLHWFGSGIRGMWGNYIYLRGLRQQNHDLKNEVDRLRIEQDGLLEDAKQGERLQKLLSFKRDYIYQTTIAQVIGTSGTDQSHVIYIDKGSHDGIKLDMAVMTPDGIVGKVRDVFPRTAQVLEISDQTSGAGVLLETTRIRGILRGNVYGQPQVVNVMPDDRIKAGEKVLTSGGDQVFPRGLPVGIVDHVVSDPEHEPYIAVMVRPGANLSRLEEVMVITSTGGQMPKQEQEDMAVSAVDGASARQRAAAALSAGLPSATDPNAAKTPDMQGKAGSQAQVDALKQSQTGIPVPIKAVPPLHPDRFTPLSVAPASELVPGQARPHVDRSAPAGGEEGGAPTSTETPKATTIKTIKPVRPGADGDPSTGATGEPKPKTSTSSSLPIKPATTKPKAAAPSPVLHAPVLDANGEAVKPKPRPKPVISPGTPSPPATGTPHKTRPGSPPITPPGSAQ